MNGLSSGERTVYGQAFIAAVGEAWSNEEAARSASAMVARLRAVDRSKLTDDQRAMLDDMLGVPR